MLYKQGAAIDVPIRSVVIEEIESQVALRVQHFLPEQIEFVQEENERCVPEERIVDNLPEEVQTLLQAVDGRVLLEMGKTV